MILALACWRSLACGRGSDDTAKPAPTTPNAAAPDAHTDAANTVEVDEGMLRDLRITTRAVESRPGGELVMLLGELAVDQRTYAEVGTPVAARVTRLLVNAGDCGSQRPNAGGADKSGAGARARRVPVGQRAPEARRSVHSSANAAWPQRRLCRCEKFRRRNRPRVKHARRCGRPVPPSPPSASSRQRTRRRCDLVGLRAAVAGRGSVIERSAVVGQMLDPATPAFRIGNLSTLWLTVHAFERDAVRIRKASPRDCRFPRFRDRTSPAR